jgi:protein-S-isoprenylcysteine O-methyltransferase Ste14
MGDPTKFLDLAEYHWFNGSFALLIAVEILIMIYTMFGNKKSVKKHKSDKGTIFIVLLTFLGSIFLSVFFRSNGIPKLISGLLLPHIFCMIGILLIFLGIVIRCTAVLTLKYAFTFNVQTTDQQHLIQTGLYKIVRNPAYSGSILSLLGVVLAYRNLISLIVVIILSFVGYGIRIKTEEKTLRTQFKNEFETYCKKTKYRLIPYIY